MARPRKDQQIDIRRAAIEQVLALIDHTPLADITLARIADAIGCRAPALYHHFSHKDALLRVVHDEGFQQLYAGKLAVAAQSGGDAFARLRLGGLAYVRFAFDHPGLYRLMFAPPLATGDGNPFLDDPGRRCLGFLRASIEACQQEGWLPGQDADQLAFLFWSSVHGAISLALIDRAPMPLPGDPARYAEQAVDAMMGFVAATRPPLPFA